MMSKGIVVLSGGMDSAVTLAHAVKELGKENVMALTFNYGQRHIKEMNAAKALAQYYKVEHIIFNIDLTQIGGSSLTDAKIDVPEFEKDEDVWKKTHVALTYVPMRNTIFIAIASAYCEALKYPRIYTGFNYIDSGGYPDTTLEYVETINKLLRNHTDFRPTLHAPLIRMTKAQIVTFGSSLRVPWHITWSCYEGNELPCGKCNACVQRAKGFDEVGLVDPVTIPPEQPPEVTHITPGTTANKDTKSLWTMQ
jgi:7-cyano-7-deazaguanine synthase